MKAPYVDASAAPQLSIVIKALNEESKIGRAIESAIKAIDLANVTGEVIVVDSLSADRTVTVAARYPVKIVQLANPVDRGCGAAVQVGFQAIRGTYVYFLDGDMELIPEFLPVAMQVLATRQDVAGVGGAIADVAVRNVVDRIRVGNRACATAGEVPHLNGGGLYRRSAICQAGGYAADRNLKAYEEAELGMRLRTSGWRLVRLDELAVTHDGHALSTWPLLARHWKSRRAMAAGVLLRSAITKPWRGAAIGLLIHPLATICWWSVLLFLLALGSDRVGEPLLLAWLALPPLGLFVQILRKRDWRHPIISFLHWHYGAAAILIGAFYRQVSPSDAVPGKVVAEPPRDVVARTA